jgi:uncharacterized protein (TIGR02996 family)
VSDESALLRAICEFPEEDTPRLIYADAIEEREPERAEFIRVQIEMVRMRTPGKHKTTCQCYGNWKAGPRVDPGSVDCKRCLSLTRYNALHAREGKLLWDDVERADGAKRSRWETWYPVDHAILSLIAGYKWFERGFASRIECGMGVFLLNAAAMFAAHPIREVHLSGPSPEYRMNPFDVAEWVWYRTHADATWAVEGEYGYIYPHHLPHYLYDFVDPPDGSGLNGDSIAFERSDLALGALSNALVAYGRERAGLTPRPVAA